MEDKGQGIPGAGPAVEASIDQQIGQIEQATEGINPAQNQQAAEHVEEDLAGQGLDAALEGLAQEGQDSNPAEDNTQVPGQEESAAPQGSGTEQNAQGAQAPGENANGDQAAEAASAEGSGEPRQEQQAQPETMEQQVAKLQEQVTKLTEQNQTLSQELSAIRSDLTEKIIPALKVLVEKAAADEKDPEKLKLWQLLLGFLALSVVGVVKESAQNVQRVATPGR